MALFPLFRTCAMKFAMPFALTLVSCLAPGAATRAAHSGSGDLRHVSHAAVRSARKEVKEVLYGDTACPCIGFDNIEGETLVALDDSEATYPADLGAHCEKWDSGVHPACKKGDAPGWCAQAWCFVDSCNCDLPILPKMSSYVPDARYRGKPLFFSYHTCGGEDTWSKAVPEIGTAGCRCIGFDGIPGSTDLLIGGQAVAYPAEIGGTCAAWDKGKHPLCKKGSAHAPAWCKAKWCYVDPCSCSLKRAVPKVTVYLPEASFTGKSLYYSYDTCESKDTFTKKHNLEACVNQETAEACESLKRVGGYAKCAWTEGGCMGAELVNHPLCTKTVRSAKGGAVVGAGPALPVALAAASLLVTY